jgi:hypothetical protein
VKLAAANMRRATPEPAVELVLEVDVRVLDEVVLDVELEIVPDVLELEVVEVDKVVELVGEEEVV